MCGIFGYSGTQPVLPELWEGLKRLEYRGYDSWGFVFPEASGLFALSKDTGEISPLATVLEKARPLTAQASATGMRVGMAHTRWATHGGVTTVNAHPHLASDGSFALAQNGIVDNYQALKAEIQAAGYTCISETDTEVIVHVLEQEIAAHPGRTFLDNVAACFRRLTGRNTLIILNFATEELIAIRDGSPLVVGRNAAGEHYVGSDVLSFAERATEMLELADRQGVRLQHGQLNYFALETEGVETLSPTFKDLEANAAAVDKGGYPDFMLKEIHEQPQTVLSAASYTEAEFQELIAAIRGARRVYTVGAGTAGFAAAQIAYLLRQLAGVSAQALLSYEIESYRGQWSQDDLLLAISQSGETADTLEAVKAFQAGGGKVASLVNMVGSLLTRISDYPFLSRTGPEICVASTKAFTAQTTWGYLLARTLQGEYTAARGEIEILSKNLSALLADQALQTALNELVELAVKPEHFFVLGRGANFANAQEGALKVKEITYKHFEGFSAGELKHGVIALVSKGTPVFGIVSQDSSAADMISALAQVKARGAFVIAVASESNELFDHYLPVPNIASETTPELQAIVNILPFQLLSYYLGKKLGNNVDKPRNLAKSVTVK